MFHAFPGGCGCPCPPVNCCPPVSCGCPCPPVGCGCPPIPLPGCCGCCECPPVCHPPINFVKHNQMTHIIPHIHPVTETTLTTHVFQNNHYFPHSQQSGETSVQQEAFFGAPTPSVGC